MMKEIRYACLRMSEQYIRHHVKEIELYSDVIEYRLDKSINTEELIDEKNIRLNVFREYNLPYVLMDQKYDVIKQVFQLFNLE